MSSIWADLESAEFEDGENPRFKVNFAGRTACIYFNGPTSRSKIARTILEGTRTRFKLRYAELSERIADDLMDAFGDTKERYLVWNAARAAECKKAWDLRILRNVLDRLNIGELMRREDVEAILDEIYVVGSVLKS